MFNGNGKLVVRDSEVQELERKLGQIEIMIKRILEESEIFLEKASADQSKEKVASEIRDLKAKFIELLGEISDRLQKSLREVKVKINQIQVAPDQNMIDTLR